MAFNGKFVLNMAHFAARRGSNLGSLIEMIGYSEHELDKDDCILDNETYNSFIEAALAESDDEFFGLHAGESLNLSAAGLIGQISLSSATVKQAMELCCEFSNLGCSALPMALVRAANHYKLVLEPNPGWLMSSRRAVEHTADGVIAFTIREFATLTRYQHQPLAVQLTRRQPGNPEEYQRVFGCPVHFNRAEIAILLSKEHVEDRILTSDYNLLRILVQHAEERSAMIREEKGFLTVVRDSILNLIKPEFPSIVEVAAHLNISTRTLQRKLASEGQSYKGLIDSLKKEMAKSYLSRPDLNINEIAFLLGYADASAFNRSFKRWFNSTPTTYKQVLRR